MIQATIHHEFGSFLYACGDTNRDRPFWVNERHQSLGVLKITLHIWMLKIMQTHYKILANHE